MWKTSYSLNWQLFQIPVAWFHKIYFFSIEIVSFSQNINIDYDFNVSYFIMYAHLKENIKPYIQ